MSRRPASPDEIRRRVWAAALHDCLLAIVLAALCVAAIAATNALLDWLARVRW